MPAPSEAVAELSAGITDTEEFPLPSPAALPSESQVAETSEAAEEGGFLLNIHFHAIPSAVWVGLAVILVLAVLVSVSIMAKKYHDKKEAQERQRRKARRSQRLKDIGCTQEDFDLILKEKRNSSYTPKRSQKHKSRHRR